MTPLSHRKTIKPGGVLDRHPLLLPAKFLSAAWIPYAIVFARSSIAFGSLGAPAQFPDPLYWILLALQLFVCVISHSLALRTIIGLYAPLWLIFGSLAFFCLSPIWGMLTTADVRYPLFAMMVCVLTSSVAFIVYSEKPKTWLWAELGLASILVCLLRGTGIWSVLPTLAALLAFQAVRDLKDRRDPRTEEAMDAMRSASILRSRLRLGAGTSAMVCVLVVVCGTFAIAVVLGLSEPLGEPPYGGVAVADDVSLSQIESTSLNPTIATGAAKAIMNFQNLPVVSVTFSYPFYVAVFSVFLVYALAKRDWRALLVGMPQVSIFVLSIVDPAHSTLAFVIPAMAAQIMFFGATLKETNVIGMPPDKERTDDVVAAKAH